MDHLINIIPPSIKVTIGLKGGGYSVDWKDYPHLINHKIKINTMCCFPKPAPKPKKPKPKK
jgi:hypothetical protein